MKIRIHSGSENPFKFCQTLRRIETTLVDVFKCNPKDESTKKAKTLEALPEDYKQFKTSLEYRPDYETLLATEV